MLGNEDSESRSPSFGITIGSICSFPEKSTIENGGVLDEDASSDFCRTASHISLAMVSSISGTVSPEFAFFMSLSLEIKYACHFVSKVGTSASRSCSILKETSDIGSRVVLNGLGPLSIGFGGPSNRA